MAIIRDIGQARSTTPIRTSGTARWLAREQEEEEERSLLRQTQLSSPVKTQASIKTAVDDPVMSVQASISRIGGIEELNYRVESLTNEWKHIMGGTPISSSVIVDLARTPVSLKMQLSALRTMARSWGMARDVDQKANEVVAERYLSRGIPMLSDSAYAKAVEDEVNKTHERRARWDPLVTERIMPNADDVAIGAYISRPFFKPIAYSQVEAWKKEYAVGTPQQPPASEIVKPSDTVIGSIMHRAGAATYPYRNLMAVSGLQFMEATGYFDKHEWDNPRLTEEEIVRKALEEESLEKWRGLGGVSGPLVDPTRDKTQAMALFTDEQRASYDHFWDSVDPVGYMMRGLGWVDAQFDKIGVFFGEKLKADAALWEASDGHPKYNKANDEELAEAARARGEAAWNTAKQIVDDEGSNYANYFLEQAGVDPKEHPVLAWGMEMGYQTGKDIILWGGLSIGARALNVPRLVENVVAKSTHLRPIAEVIAETKSAATISKITGITRRESLTELVNANTVDQVNKALTQMVVEGKGFITGGQYLAWDQLKFRAWRGMGASESTPYLLRQSLTSYPERHLLVTDDEMLRSVEAVGNAFGATADDILVWGDKALLADSRSERIGILKNMFDDLAEKSGDKYVRLKDYMKTRYPSEPGSTGTAYNLHQWAKPGEDPMEYLVIQRGERASYLGRIRDRYAQELEWLERREMLLAYTKPGAPVDIKFAELRRVGLTQEEADAVLAGGMSVKQAAAAVTHRGGTKVGYGVEGEVEHIDDILRLSDQEDVLMPLLGPSARGSLDMSDFSALTFTTKTGRMGGAVGVKSGEDNLLVNGLGVAQDLQQRGIGTRLISSVAELAAKEGKSVTFALGDEWESALSGLGVRKTLEGYFLSAEQATKIAASTTARDAERLIKMALKAEGKDYEDFVKFVRAFDNETERLAQVRNYAESMVPTSKEIRGRARQMLAAHKEMNSQYDEMADFIARSGVHIRGTEYEAAFAQLSESQLKIIKSAKFINEKGWDKFGRNVAGTLRRTEVGARIGQSLDELATEVAAMFPNLVKSDTAVQDVIDFMLSYQGKKKLKDFMEPAETMLYNELLTTDELGEGIRDLRALADYVERQAPLSRGLIQDVSEMEAGALEEMLEAMTDEVLRARNFIDDVQTRAKIDTFDRVPDEFYSKAANQEDLLSKLSNPDKRMETLRNKISGMDDTIAKLTGEGESFAVPLMPFQLQQYYVPPIPLPAIATMAGEGFGSKAIYELERHVNRQLISSVNMNICADTLVGMWKKYLLAAPGIMTKVVMDEPLRMLLQGYPIQDLLFGPLLGRGKSIRWMERMANDPEMKAAAEFAERVFNDESWMPRLTYLYDQIEPGSFHAITGNMPGWAKSAAHVVSVHSKQPPVRAWIKEPGVDSLIAWARTPQGKEFISKAMGVANEKSIRQWAEATDEYLYWWTHVPIRTVDRPLGDLSAAQIKAYNKWVKNGKQGDPPFDIPPGAEVRSGRLARVHTEMEEMLRGYDISVARLNKIIPENRPIIAGPKPRAYVDTAGMDKSAATAARGVLSRPADAMYAAFDTVMRNTRKTIFARELRKRYEELERMAADAIERTAKEGGERMAIPDPKVIWSEAEKFARAKVENMTYNAYRTGMEYALRDIIPFLPATRDFLVYYAEQAIKHPPLGLALMRVQDMPDQVEIPLWSDAMMAIGGAFDSFAQWIGDLEGPAQWTMKPFQWASGLASEPFEVMAQANWFMNPRTMQFFTGGASPVTGDGAVDANETWTMIREQFPGFSFMVTMPAEYIYDSDRETFGWIPRMIGFERVGSGGALNTRIAKAYHAVTTIVGSLGSGGLVEFFKTGKLTGGDWDGAELPGFLGRDPSSARRYAVQILRAFSVMGNIDWSDPEAAAARVQQMADEMSGKVEGATAFMNLLLPGSMWLKEKETQDITDAFNAYTETYSALEDQMQAAGYMDPGGIVMMTGEKTRADLRENYPEYAQFFDYLDALQHRDRDAIDRIALDNPGVLSFFVSAYSDLTEKQHSEKMKAEGIDPDTWEGWLWKKEHELVEPVDTEQFAGRLKTKVADMQSYVNGKKMMDDFNSQWAGREGTQEYADAKEEIVGRIEELGYRTTPWYNIRPLTRMEKEAAAAVEENDRRKAIALELQESIEMRNQLGEDWNDRRSAPLYKAIKAEFNAKFEEMGLTRTRTLPTVVEKEHDQLVSFIRSDPWSWSQEDWEAHEMGEWTEEWQKERLLYALEQDRAYKAMKDLGTTWWTDKNATNRDAYNDYVSRMCQASPAFAASWDYYTAQDWERLRDTGEATSAAWREFFTARAALDNRLLEGKILDQNGKPVSVIGFTLNGEKVEGTSKAVTNDPYFQKFVEFVGKLKEADHFFAKEFERFDWSFWNYERKW